MASRRDPQHSERIGCKRKVTARTARCPARPQAACVRESSARLAQNIRSGKHEWAGMRGCCAFPEETRQASNFCLSVMSDVLQRVCPRRLLFFFYLEPWIRERRCPIRMSLFGPAKFFGRFQVSQFNVRLYICSHAILPTFLKAVVIIYLKFNDNGDASLMRHVEKNLFNNTIYIRRDCVFSEYFNNQKSLGL